MIGGLGLIYSYAALGLLSNIPLPQGASSSRSHRAKLPFLPGQAATRGQGGDEDEEDLLRNAVVGYGRIVRDEEGNVIDIILPEDEAPPALANADVEVDEEEEEDGPRVVEAKTDVVRCEFDIPSFYDFQEYS